MRGMDESVHFQLQGKTSLLSEGSTLERNELISAGGQRTLRNIISIAVLKSNNRVVCKKPTFMFGHVALDSDQQLAVPKDQWILSSRRTSINSLQASVISRSPSSS